MVSLYHGMAFRGFFRLFFCGDFPKKLGLFPGMLVGGYRVSDPCNFAWPNLHAQL